MEYLGEVIELFPRAPRSREGVTFKHLADEFLRTEAAGHVCPGNDLRHVAHLAALWDMTEVELRPRAIKQAFMELSKTLGPATLNKIRATGRRIVKEAQANDEWTGPNPFDMVDRKKETKKKHRRLSLEEVRVMLPRLRFDRRVQALFMIYLGPRPGEERGLKKRDVDLRAGTILIHRSYGRDSTKTGKERFIPIPEGLWPWLEDAVRSSPHRELVFPAPNGKMDVNNKMSRTLRLALAEAGIVEGYTHICRRKGCDYRDERPDNTAADCPKCEFKLWASPQYVATRWYDLRHSSATLHRRAGADPLAIQILLGHAPESLTDSLYTDMTIDDLRRELGKLEI